METVTTLPPVMLAMETYWAPGVNSLTRYGRWAFAEFTDVYAMQADFAAKVAAEFDKMIGKVMVKETVDVS